jgi:hypothetical protein
MNLHDWENPAPSPPNPYDLERRIALLEQSNQTIKEELSKMNTNLNKLVWIVLGAVVIAVMNLLLQNGVT